MPKAGSPFRERVQPVQTVPPIQGVPSASSDAHVLRAEAEQLRREMEVLTSRADAMGRRALELEAQARDIEAAQVIVPFAVRKRWGALVIVDAERDG